MRHGYMRLRQKLNINTSDVAPIAVAAGPVGTTPIYTTNGIDWQEGTVSAPWTGAMVCQAYGNNQYMMMSTSSNSTAMTVITSTDGINWTARAKGFTSTFGTGSAPNRFIFSPTFGSFIGIANSTTDIYRTTDGITWTTEARPSTWLLNLSALHDTGNSILIGSYANDGSSRVVRTTNLTSWTTTKTTGTTPLDWPLYFVNTPSRIILTNQGSFSQSTNSGTSWTAFTGPQSASSSSHRIVRGPNGRLVYLGGSNITNTKYSDDNGTTWTSASGSILSASNGRLIVTHNNRYIYFTGNANATQYAFSNGGAYWELLPMPVTWTAAGCALIASPAP